MSGDPNSFQDVLAIPNVSKQSREFLGDGYGKFLDAPGVSKLSQYLTDRDFYPLSLNKVKIEKNVAANKYWDEIFSEEEEHVTATVNFVKNVTTEDYDWVKEALEAREDGITFKHIRPIYEKISLTARVNQDGELTNSLERKYGLGAVGNIMVSVQTTSGESYIIPIQLEDATMHGVFDNESTSDHDRMIKSIDIVLDGLKIAIDEKPTTPHPKPVIVGDIRNTSYQLVQDGENFTEEIPLPSN
jgi:hypothetical protein